MPSDELPTFVHSLNGVVDESLDGVALGVRVADDFVAGGTAEEFVYGSAYGLSFDVPEGDIDGADGAAVCALGGEEVASEHELPEAFGLPRIGSNNDFC